MCLPTFSLPAIYGTNVFKKKPHNETLKNYIQHLFLGYWSQSLVSCGNLLPQTSVCSSPLGNSICYSEAKVKLASDCCWIDLLSLSLIIQIWITLSVLLLGTKFFRFQTSSLKYSYHNPSYSLATGFLWKQFFHWLFYSWLTSSAIPGFSQVNGCHPNQTEHILFPTHSAFWKSSSLCLRSSVQTNTHHRKWAIQGNYGLKESVCLGWQEIEEGAMASTDLSSPLS